MIRALTVLAALVALAVFATPASAVSDGMSNGRLAVLSPPTPPGVPIPYPNVPDPVQVPKRPIK